MNVFSGPALFSQIYVCLWPLCLLRLDRLLGLYGLEAITDFANALFEVKVYYVV